MAWWPDMTRDEIDREYGKTRQEAVKEAQNEARDPKTTPARRNDLEGLIKKYQ